MPGDLLFNLPPPPLGYYLNGLLFAVTPEFVYTYLGRFARLCQQHAGSLIDVQAVRTAARGNAALEAYPLRDEVEGRTYNDRLYETERKLAGDWGESFRAGTNTKGVVNYDVNSDPCDLKLVSPAGNKITTTGGA